MVDVGAERDARQEKAVKKMKASEARRRGKRVVGDVTSHGLEPPTHLNLILASSSKLHTVH